jgi:hypothetical protein
MASSKHRRSQFGLWYTRDRAKARVYEECFQNILSRSTTTLTSGLLQGQYSQLEAGELPRFGPEKVQSKAVSLRYSY